MESLKSKSKTNGHSELIADAFGRDLLEMSEDELLTIGAQEGINWVTPGRQSELDNVESTARRLSAHKPSRAIAWLQSGMVAIGELVLMLVMLSIQNILMPLGTLGLGYIEVLRVRQGWATFDVPTATIASTVIVVFAIGVLFARAEDAENDKKIARAYYAIVFVIMTLGTAGVLHDETDATPTADYTSG
jgi:hypothetical protein